jgi:hypothetical protein
MCSLRLPPSQFIPMGQNNAHVVRWKTRWYYYSLMRGKVLYFNERIYLKTKYVIGKVESQLAMHIFL